MSETPPLTTPALTKPDNGLPPEPPPHRPRRLWKILLGAGIGLGSLAAVGGAVFYVWGDRLITNLLLPRVAQALDESIQRPVEIGDVESFQFWGVTLGETVIPPTETDASSVTVEGIEISIGLRSLLFQQTLKSKVVLIRPEVSLIQAEDGQWLELNLPEPSEAERPVELEIESIEVKDASISALPFSALPSTENSRQAMVPRDPIQIEDTNVLVEFFGESAQEATFELDGEVLAKETAGSTTNAKAAGRFEVNGAANIETQTVKANAQISNLPGTGVNLLLPDSLGLRSGDLDGNLTASADFNDGVLDQSSLDVNGTAQFQNGEFLISGLPAPIQNIDSALAFKGQRVSLQDASLQLNDITLFAEGDVDLNEGYNLTTQIPSVSIAEVRTLVDVDLPVPVEGAFSASTQVTGALERPVLKGQLTSVQPLLIDQVALEAVEADFGLTLPEFQPTRFILEALRAQPETGGQVVASGLADLSDLDNPTFQLDGQANLPVDGLAQIYGASFSEAFVIGVLAANFEASGSLDSQVASADWQLSEGTFSGSGEVALSDNVVLLENARLQAAQGMVAADAVLDLDNGNWQATATTDQVAVSQFTRQAQGLVSVDVEALGNVNDLALDQIAVQGTARVTNVDAVGGSAAADFALERGNWQVSAKTDGIAVSQFTNRAQGLLSANIDAFGTLAALGNLAELDSLSDLNLAKVEARGTAVIADAQAQLTDNGVPLLAPGNWTTAFALAENAIAVQSFTAPNLQADGTIGIDLSKTIPIADLALNVALQSYDLQRLNSFAPTSVTEYAQVNGFTSFVGQLFGPLENLQLSGNAQLNNLAVNDLLFEPLSGPVNFAIADGGQVDLQGQQDRLQLTFRDSPQQALPYWPVSFNVQSQDLIANGVTEGNLLRTQVVQLPLERLSIRPPAQYGLGTVTGTLAANVNVNLASLTNPTAAGTLVVTQPSLSPVEAQQLNAAFTYAGGTATLNEGELLFNEGRYLLTGSANVDSFNNLSNIAYQGDLTIDQGRVEDFIPLVEAIDFSAFGLDDGQVGTGSAIDLETQPVGVPAAEPFLAKLESFMAFLAANPSANLDTNNSETLGNTNLPPLNELEGAFSGTIAVAGSTLSLADATADFDIQGNSWTWGENTPTNEFALRGEVARSQVDINTAFVNAGDTAIDLTATGDVARLNGQLVINDLPVEVAQLIYPLPAAVTGSLDLNTTLGGSLTNPAVQGDAVITDPQVNGYPLEGITANFDYRNAVLSLDSEVAVAAQTQPITVAGRVPYALPFSAVIPSTTQLDVMTTVPNGNLEIINALTNGEVFWQSGQGEILVEVGGTLFQPTVAGTASFRDGVLSSTFLKDNVTNINGEVAFNLQQLDVQQLQANINGGQLAVNGRLPLLLTGESIATQLASNSLFSNAHTPQPTQAANGLVIALDSLPVDYDNLLQAVFDGQMLVTGALLSPTISGDVEINNGEIQANNFLRRASAFDFPTTSEVQSVSPYRIEFLDIDLSEVEPEAPEGVIDLVLDRVALRNFGLRFGDRLAIVGQPFYNITADGEVVVSGALSNLQPSGVIELKSGWINLFSTQFRLDRTESNTATFSPENGLDPILDVVMLARVQETDITPSPPSAGGFLDSEINEPQVDSTGDVQFVSVSAIAQGPVSEIKDSLTLTSRPSREQGELLALLGSSVVGSLTGSSLTQIGGFVGGGTLATIGDRLADAVGLQSFSVFPTTDTSDDSSVGIGIGVEASAAIGDRFNINILEILNSTNAPQLGVRYRLTDEVDIRGASNLEDTDFEIEYRIKF
ncbi:MAG: translocation/assembly module TamB domain-containing protein [Phormidesmis sp.]